MERHVHKAIATYNISPSSIWRSSNALGKPSVQLFADFWTVSTCLHIPEMDSHTGWIIELHVEPWHSKLMVGFERHVDMMNERERERGLVSTIY